MTDLPGKPFEDWTMADVVACAAGEAQDTMPGSGRVVPGPRRKLLRAMQEAGVERAGDLEPVVRDRHKFSLLMLNRD